MNDPTDFTATRKKFLLKRFIMQYNKDHPNKPIVIPEKFDPSIPYIGETARDLLKVMQKASRLEVTGFFNKPTMLKLLPPGIRGEVMSIAHAELGVHEWPPSSNRGEVLKYLKSAGIPFGAPWCVSFVYWVLIQAGFKREHLPSGPASTPNWHLFAKSHGCIKPVRLSEYGDIWLWEWNNGDGMLDHGGFCDDGIEGMIAYYLDGNVGAYGGSVTDSQRSVANVAYCIDLVKLHNLK
jgi:hypothetical protein